MTWTVEKAKQILGITGTGQDAEIQHVMDTTRVAIETMLQRGLLEQEDTQLFHYLFTSTIRLRRFPVKEITDIDGDVGINNDWSLDQESGLIYLPCRTFFDKLTITYTGGYEILPLDLERAMWEAFVYLWNRTESATGNPESGLETSPSGAQNDISRVTIQDFGSVTFDTTGIVSGEAVTDRMLNWGWLAPWASTLEFYRSEYGTGLGVK